MKKITCFKENCMIIRVRKESIVIRGNLYEAVRRCWRANMQMAQKADYVLAVVGTLKNIDLEVKAVYKTERWYCPADEGLCKIKKEECTKKYKVNTDLCLVHSRIAFEGIEIKEINYLHNKIPADYYPLQNPFRYTYK